MDDRSGPLDDALGHRFRDPSLLAQALTHASAGVARHGQVVSNERLEFLGDRVLGLLVARMLYERFPGEDEGALSRRQAGLVRREALVRVARAIGLDRAMRLSAAEDEAGRRDNPNLLADACEAVIAALFLDGGLAAADSFVRCHWAALVEAEPEPPRDAKTALQEWAQGRGLPLPAYRESGREGPPHAPRFAVTVTLAGFAPEAGEGASKRVAEQDAAGRLLARLERGSR